MYSSLTPYTDLESRYYFCLFFTDKEVEEEEELAQDYIAGQWQIWDLNPGGLAPDFAHLIPGSNNTDHVNHCFVTTVIHTTK